MANLDWVRNPSRALKLILALALVVVGAFVFRAGFRESSMKWHSGKPPIADKSVLSIDRENLSKPNASAAEIFGALVRLAKKGDSIARDEALRRKADLSPLIREGCAAALGYFEDTATLSALVSLFEDKELKVRTRAIEALSYHWSQERQNLLEKLLAKEGLPVSERIAVDSSLIRMSPKEEERAKAIRELVKTAKGGGGVTGGEADSAAMELISLAPRDSFVVDMLRDVLVKGGRTQLAPSAVRQLSAMQDEWIRGHLASLRKSPDFAVRLAVIQSLHLACPPDRFEILKNSLLSESESGVLQASFEELSIFADQKALQLAEQSEHWRKLEGPEALHLKTIISELKKKPGADPCINVRSK